MTQEEAEQPQTQADTDTRPTGIDALDTILHGGILEGHVVLLAGNSGTGKTIFSMEWLFRGYQAYDEPGLYITLTESVTTALKNIQNLSFYAEGLVDPSQVHFADLRTTVKLLNLEDRTINKEDINEMLNAIEQLVEDTGAQRVVIDSITAVAYLLEDKDLIRTFIFRLGTMLSDHDVTTILTSEVSGDSYSVYGVEEFISDGIIKLQQDPVQEDLRRTLQVIKMRGMEYESNPFPFTIEDSGIRLYVKQPRLEYGAPTTRVSSGIPGLDDMTDGGLLEGSVSLVSGPTGSGKTLSSLHFTCNALENGENVLFVSFEESRPQLLRMAAHFGWDLERYEDEDRLHMRCHRASEMYPEEHIYEILETVDAQDIDRVVVDSLTGIRNTYPEEHFRGAVRDLSLALKERGVTTVMTSSHASMIGTEAASKGKISTLMDNIFLLNYVEAQGRLKYSIAVLKTRGTDHDRALREYDITDNGITIGTALSAYEGVMTGSARKIGESAEERMRKEFFTFLGPIGESEFEQLHENGITEDSIKAYIDNLVETGAVEQENAELFKERMCAILRGEDVPELEQKEDAGNAATGEKARTRLKRLLGGE